MKKQILLKLGLVLLIINSMSCIWIQVQEDVDYPKRDFEAAFSKVEEMMDENPERDGTASGIHIMVYDGGSRDYVNLVIPVSLIQAGTSFVSMDEINAGVAAEGIDIEKLIENVWDMGPGLIVQVDDAQSDTTVLIWME